MLTTLLTIGSISGNDTNAVIKNSSAQDAILTTGLYAIMVCLLAKLPRFFQRGAMRADAVVSSALGDITRQAGLALIPQFADRLVPNPVEWPKMAKGFGYVPFTDNRKIKVTEPQMRHGMAT